MAGHDVIHQAKQRLASLRCRLLRQRGLRKAYTTWHGHVSERAESIRILRLVVRRWQMIQVSRALAMAATPPLAVLVLGTRVSASFRGSQQQVMKILETLSLRIGLKK